METTEDAIIKELRIEQNQLRTKINKLKDFKYKDTESFLKLGSMMCQLLDIQLSAMETYDECLTARIIYLDLHKNYAIV